MRNVLSESGINYVAVANEATFYDPKIDVQVWSAIGREFTIEVIADILASIKEAAGVTTSRYELTCIGPFKRAFA